MFFIIIRRSFYIIKLNLVDRSMIYNFSSTKRAVWLFFILCLSLDGFCPKKKTFSFCTQRKKSWEFEHRIFFEKQFVPINGPLAQLAQIIALTPEFELRRLTPWWKSAIKLELSLSNELNSSVKWELSWKWHLCHCYCRLPANGCDYTILRFDENAVSTVLVDTCTHTHSNRVALSI